MVYQQMAYVYDALMENAPYDKWLTVTEMIFKKENKPIQSILDIGCGTGQMTIRLAESGYQTVGVDISEDMLAYAQFQAQEKHLPIQWIHQDVRTLEVLNGFDAIVSYCDVMNYITTEDELCAVFHNIYNALNDDGIFIFDVHSVAHVHNNMINQTFADVRDDVAYIWFCESGDNLGEMYHDLTFFIRDDNNTFEKFSEEHHQRTFKINSYINLLKEAGFEKCKVYADFDVNNHFEEGSAERIFFSAMKTSEK
ncbi:MAG TPA: class I SAM-dependent methyltransferase [Virgibacillus sp.]|nr:class I SAM-dependent methyltransferase [Virgibacillus sp.]